MNRYKGKLIITNIVLAVICIVAIVTLLVGDFWQVKLVLNIDGKAMAELMQSTSGSENTGDGSENVGDGSEENANLSEGEGLGGEGAGEGSGLEGEGSGEGVQDGSDELANLFGSVNLTIPLDVKFTPMGLIGMLTGKGEETVNTFIGTEMGEIIDVLMGAVDEIMTSVTAVVVDMVLDEAMAEVERQLEEQLYGEITEEDIMNTLETEYDITEEDIESLKGDVATATKGLINGDSDAVTTTLQDSETLEKLIAIYAAQELEQEGIANPTQEQINEKTASLKTEIIEECDKGIEEISGGEEFDKETVVVTFIKESGMVPEEEASNIQTIDDVKATITNNVNNSMDAETKAMLVTVGQVLAGILLLTVASWIYLLIKLIVKTLFMKNKGVRLTAPRLLGWVPHVIFVGLPQLLFGNMDMIFNALANQPEMAEMAEAITAIGNMFSLQATSLTYISAICSVLLLVIGIPYGIWRRRNRKLLKEFPNG